MSICVEHLSSNVVRQLRSSLVVISLWQCLQELVYNALDAGSTRIEITVDVDHFYVQVKDNGTGIPASAMGKIASRHVTSKCHSLTDLNTLHTFGYRGEALAAMTDISILQIISRYKDPGADTVKSIWKDGLLLVKTPHSPMRQSGTQVTVRDLFYKFPVRRKRREHVDGLQRNMANLVLAFPHVSFSMVDLSRDIVVLKTKACSSSRDSFRQVFGPNLAQHIGPFKVHEPGVQLQGYFGKFTQLRHQFIYLNRHYLEHNELYQAVLATFEYCTDNSPTHKGRTTPGKHPFFLIHIEWESLSTFDIQTWPDHKWCGQLLSLLRRLTANYLRSKGQLDEARFQSLKSGRTGVVQLNTAAETRTLTHPSSSENMASSMSHLSDAVSTEGGFKIPIKLSKEELQEAEVIGQVDGKYIAIVAQRKLVLIDQHAADERIKFEQMLAQLDAMETIQLDPVLKLYLEPADSELVARYGSLLETWGVRIKLLSLASEHSTSSQASRHFATLTESHYFEQNQPQFCVTHLPRIIADRCILHPEQLQEMILEHLASLDDSQRVHTCPAGIMAMLKSKACRGAIMFNDTLSLSQCTWIIQHLAHCQYPFQCAHGRPSMVPLIQLDDVGTKQSAQNPPCL